MFHLHRLEANAHSLCTKLLVVGPFSANMENETFFGRYADPPQTNCPYKRNGIAHFEYSSAWRICLVENRWEVLFSVLNLNSCCQFSVPKGSQVASFSHRKNGPTGLGWMFALCYTGTVKWIYFEAVLQTGDISMNTALPCALLRPGEMCLQWVWHLCDMGFNKVAAKSIHFIIYPEKKNMHQFRKKKTTM